VADPDDAAEARALLEAARHGALATLEAGGAPFVSLVAVATDAAGAPLMLLSSLARHSRNIAADPRAALLIAPAGTGDPMAAARLTVSGEMTRCDVAEARERFLARQPEARRYADFSDFTLWRLMPREAHLVAGFGRIRALPAAALVADG
jgi:putative heme iron utilization protein